MAKKFLIFLFWIQWPLFLFAESSTLLHLTFHRGCAKEFEAVGRSLGIEVVTWFIPDLPPFFFDGISQGNVLYNMGHERAERVWLLHKDFFEQFDGIVTSDTAPLARIFLQNDFKKPLMIWICNRFDYSDQASLDCSFPDPEFYRLFNEAYLRENVAVVAYNAFEHHYARKKGVETGSLVITPCCPEPLPKRDVSAIPESVVREDTFFLPPYLNETFYFSFSTHCERLGIPNYCGRYQGPEDLRGFKGIIHLPYAWSNLAFFENLTAEVPYFLPSSLFLRSLLEQGGYWHTNPDCLLEEGRFDLSEWYQSGREEIITYFDSWEDLQQKINSADYPRLRKKIRAYGKKYRAEMLAKWTELFHQKGLKTVFQSQGF